MQQARQGGNGATHLLCNIEGSGRLSQTADLPAIPTTGSIRWGSPKNGNRVLCQRHCHDLSVRYISWFLGKAMFSATMIETMNSVSSPRSRIPSVTKFRTTSTRTITAK